MSSTTRLPEELLRLIVGYLDEEGDKEALIACSSAFKALLPLARAHLFSFLKLCCCCFEGGFLLQNLHLLQYVKDVVISAEPASTNAAWLTELDDAFFRDILRRPLGSLRLEGVRWGDIPAGPVRRFLLKADALEVDIDGECFRTEDETSRFLSTFPSARSVRLTGGNLLAQSLSLYSVKRALETNAGGEEIPTEAGSGMRPRRVVMDCHGRDGEKHALVHPSIDLSEVDYLELMDITRGDRSLEEVFAKVAPSIRELILPLIIDTTLDVDAATSRGGFSLHRAVNLEKLTISLSCYTELGAQSCIWAERFLQGLRCRGPSVPMREMHLHVESYTDEDDVANGSFDELDAAISAAPWSVMDNVLSGLSSAMLEVKVDVFVHVLIGETPSDDDDEEEEEEEEEKYAALRSKIRDSITQRYLPRVARLGILRINCYCVLLL